MTLERAASFLTAFFASAALVMAMLAIYGVVSYAVRQGTVEIGTRIALGATSRNVVSLIVGNGLKMAAYGVIGGAVAAFVASFYLRRVFSIEALGAAPFLYSTAIAGTIAIAASFLPAWRASLVSPMVAIRNEPSSMWQAARLQARRALRALSDDEEPPVVPLGTLITEFAGAPPDS